MVATDIAARGIDVSQVSHVINYDIPDTVDAYTHRTGRTGRMERLGTALSLVTREDFQMVRTIERVTGQNFERLEVKGLPKSQTPIKTTTNEKREKYHNWNNGKRSHTSLNA
jgi:ATP-dependent RNA helicase RhlE